MSDEGELPEWTARRIAWREQWDEVRPFVQDSSVADRIAGLFASDPARARHRSIVTLGVYTSLRLNDEEFDALKEDWVSALTLIRAHCPEAVPDFHEYFRNSVMKFAELKGIAVHPQEFGF